MDKNPSQKIDLVYTWVDGHDPDYLELMKRYAEKLVYLNPERTRDIYHMLKYSLRSIEKYAPWIHTIYIFTCPPQRPSWLNIDHPKIRVVHHDEVFNTDDFPTFNYNIIESYIHKIPGLSDEFIYLNDDFLFGNNVHPSDFFSKDGKILIHGTCFGENIGWRIYNKKNNIIGLGLIEHSPLLIKKEWWQKMQEVRANLINDTKAHKFRKGTDVMMYKLYRWYALQYERAHCQPIKLPDLLKIQSFHKITNHFKKQKKSIEKLKSKKPKFICLNDDQGENPNPDTVNLIQEFLNETYNEKSSFEW